ncbi:MAG: photosynthetic reaction center cytochrome PufC [Polyangiaceae bacterium]|jgi:photosynthetic reaction center cytochrome c subunit|nr:photosynthetic reaction center cytochrome PufC [Polyangiaceae bacterium]
MNPIAKGAGALGGVLVAMATVAAYDSTAGAQKGAPGIGMETVSTLKELAEKTAENQVPFMLPPAPKDGARAVDAYKNVQVLGHLSSAEVTRLMASITQWVAPDQGCAYCHAPQRDANGKIVLNDLGYPLADNNNMHSDEVYAKVVARRMIQMTMHINQDWQAHVQKTGVTCWTCHRGNPVPKNVWYDVPEQDTRFGGIPGPPNQHAYATNAGLSSLPHGSFRPFLVNDENIRVQSNEAIDPENRASIKQAEWTYGLMMHMSSALGVNCTYCHNSRSMGEWNTSPLTRTTAWYGIRMVRDLNKEYVEPLTAILPPQRLGPMGDGPKANCATCHQGAYKPLLGVSMLPSFPELAAWVPQPQKTKTPEPDPSAAPAASASGAPATSASAMPAASGSAPPAASASGAPSAAPSGATGAPSGSSAIPEAKPASSARP